MHQVLHQQGLGKYCDRNFIRYASREMQEALQMTTEEMDRAAHLLMTQGPVDDTDAADNRNRNNTDNTENTPRQQSPNSQL